MLILRILALATVFAACPTALSQVWEELGPAPVSGFGGAAGRMPAVAPSRVDPNLLYVAGADGGVWRSRNGGVTWTPLTDQQETLATGALALAPSNELVIYAGTGEGNNANHSRYGLGVLRSTDGGDTWTLLGRSVFEGRSFTAIEVDPRDWRVVYAAVTRAGGFHAIGAGPNAVPPGARRHPMGNGPRGVFKSTDGGVTWTHLTNGVPALCATDLHLDPVNPDLIYACIGFIYGSPDNGLYRSTDGGATWSRMAGGLPTANVGRLSVAVARSNPNRMYVYAARPCDAAGGGASTLGAWRSSDAGASWTSIPVPSVQSTFGWYLATLTVNPTNPDQVFFGGVSVVRSDNAGASYTTVSPPHPDVHAAAWDASGRLILGDDGGVHRTSNAGANWTSLNQGLGTIQFYAGLSTHPTDDEVIIGGTQDNGTNRRPSTGGMLWQSVNGGDGGWTQIDQSNPLIVFAESQGTGTIARSTNGGFNFTGVGGGISGRNCFLPPYLIDPALAGRMIYATERIFESVNTGLNFLPISPDLTKGGSAAIRSLAMAPSDPNRVYAATNDGRVLASSDGGRNFSLIRSSNPGWPRTTREMFVDPADRDHMYLAGAAFGVTRVQRTTDGGLTWQPLDAGLPDIPVNTVAADSRYPTPRIYAGTDKGLWYSPDLGRTWRRFGTGLPNAVVVDILLQPTRRSGGRMIVGTQGRGAWRIRIHCPADLNRDDAIDFNDYLEFLNLFNTSDADVDFNADGVVDFNDYLSYLNLFNAGC